MQKKSLLALMLALTMLLSGCTLIQKDPAVDAATEIIRLGDDVVTKGEIQDQVNYQLNYMSYLYSMYGYQFDPTSEQNIADARDAVISSFKTRMVSDAKIREMGLDQLTEEENAKIQEDAEAAWQDNLDYILSDNEDLEGLTDEEKNEKAKAQLEETGYTMESAIENARETLLRDKLRQEIIKDVAVTEEEIQADFDSKVASAKETYENNAGSWAQARNNGTTLYYTPAGVRYVKQILVKFTDEDQEAIDAAQSALDAANSKVTEADSQLADAQAILDDEAASEEDKTAAEGDRAAAQEKLDAAKAEALAAQEALDAAREKAFAGIEGQADEILAQIAEGADWDALMAEKTQDPGMQSGATAERGYAVSADMTNFDSAFVEAAMALENIGDVSDKIRGNAYGYYIIKYVSDAVEGPIDLEEVRAGIESSLLSTKQDETYDAAEQSWLDAAENQFKVDLKALD